MTDQTTTDDPLKGSRSTGHPALYWRNGELRSRKTHEVLATVANCQWSVTCGDQQFNNLPEELARQMAVGLASEQLMLRRPVRASTKGASR